MPIDRTPSRAPEPSALEAAPPDPRIAEVAAWLGQFSRTLKTCRLYDAKNPTSIKFREDLSKALLSLLSAHGGIALEFTANEVRFDGQPVLTARTREDNFAMPFYRDGLRTLLFQPDLEAPELDRLLDLVLAVTAHRSNGSEDLVTLLWDADLPHIDMAYVSSETDADMGGDEGENVTQLSAERAAELMPWPGGGAGRGAGGGGKEGGEQGTDRDGAKQSGAPGDSSRSSEAGGGPMAGPTGASGKPGEPGAAVRDEALQLRSEDWLASDPVHELEACYREIEATRAEEAERFMHELTQERAEELIARALGQVRSALSAELLPGDRADLSAMLGRVLQECIGGARWADARATVECIVQAEGGTWDTTPLVNALTQPESLVTAAVVRHLDESSAIELGEFASFARVLGPPATEWIMGIVAIATHQRARRALMRTLTDLCEGNPERLAPWLADERWFVVRNAVAVIGSTEGGAPVGLFRPLLTHPEPRVRQEVITALANCPPPAARPLLLELIHDTEAVVRNAALHQLGAKRHPETSAALLRIVVDAGFRKRPLEDVRAVLGALGGCAGDEALPHLEEQLIAPRWFSAGAAPHCQAVAFCIARIGTPAAVAMLQRGADSKTPATRDACRLVLKGMGRG